MKKDTSLFLITLATLVLGLDYLWNFFPGLPAFFSLSRFVFLGVFFADLLLYPGKYLRSINIYIACGLIIVGCMPFLLLEGDVFGENIISQGIKLLGIFAYLIFFYFNCLDAKTARRICTILFLSSGVIAIYVIGSQLEIFGNKIDRWRGAVQFTSASGIFDPNLIAVYFLPVFAFGPLVKYRWKNMSGKMINLVVVLYICVCFVAFFQLNTRSGSLAVAACMIAALTLRFLIIPRQERGGRLNAILFLAIVVASLVYVQVQYNILESIIGIYEETDLSTDSSFAARRAAYNYLLKDLFSSPDLLGGGYHAYWKESGWSGFWPHCVFVDVYIKGGVIFLLTYLILFIGSVVISLKKAFSGEDLIRRSCFAGFFCFMVGLLPLAATLSIGNKKLPWAIMGCIFGLAAGSRNKKMKEIKDGTENKTNYNSGDCDPQPTGRANPGNPLGLYSED